MPSSFQDFRVGIDEELEKHCQFDSGCPTRLAEAIRYCLLAPGKRIRPILVLQACQTCGGDWQSALPAACAVEMIHTYSLIHDDLPAMDDDDLRRGKPSCHIAFGEDIAILAGDALQAMAFEALSTLPTENGIAANCCRVLASAAGPAKLVGGQADDLAGFSHLLGTDLADRTEQDTDKLRAWLEKVNQRKTAALLIAALELGAVCASADNQMVNSLKKYGQNLGLAFQIVDDLLDICGNEAKIGKPIGSDAENGKLTFPQLLGQDESHCLAENITNEAIAALEVFGNKAEPLAHLARYVLKRNN